MMYQVVETFVSINGEGVRAGELAAFIRFSSCNLNCSYCDTRWANQPGAPFEEKSAEQLLEWVRKTGVKNVTLTGGEPLYREGIGDLTALLLQNGNRVEIETNGSVLLEPFAKSSFRPVFTMDYKLPDSGMERYMNRKNFAVLNGDDTVKFVAGSKNDLRRALEIIRQYQLTERCHVYFSPVFGMIEPSDIVAFMTEHGLNGVRLQLQLHKFIWDPNKRGV
ncbi:MAG: putative 7-carboxy-7-deazaguanine synthase QueE [Ruminococcus sp.]